MGLSSARLSAAAGSGTPSPSGPPLVPRTMDDGDALSLLGARGARSEEVSGSGRLHTSDGYLGVGLGMSMPQVSAVGIGKAHHTRHWTVEGWGRSWVFQCPYSISLPLPHHNRMPLSCTGAGRSARMSPRRCARDRPPTTALTRTRARTHAPTRTPAVRAPCPDSP